MNKKPFETQLNQSHIIKPTGKIQYFNIENTLNLFGKVIHWQHFIDSFKCSLAVSFVNLYKDKNVKDKKSLSMDMWVLYGSLDKYKSYRLECRLILRILNNADINNQNMGIILKVQCVTRYLILKQFNGDMIDQPDKVQNLDFSLNTNLVSQDNISDLAQFLSNGLNLIFNNDEEQHPEFFESILAKCLDIIASDYLAKFIQTKFMDFISDKDASKIILRLGTKQQDLVSDMPKENENSSVTKKSKEESKNKNESIKQERNVKTIDQTNKIKKSNHKNEQIIVETLIDTKSEMNNVLDKNIPLKERIRKIKNKCNESSTVNNSTESKSKDNSEQSNVIDSKISNEINDQILTKEIPLQVNNSIEKSYHQKANVICKSKPKSKIGLMNRSKNSTNESEQILDSESLKEPIIELETQKEIVIEKEKEIVIEKDIHPIEELNNNITPEQHKPKSNVNAGAESIESLESFNPQGSADNNSKRRTQSIENNIEQIQEDIDMTESIESEKKQSKNENFQNKINLLSHLMPPITALNNQQEELLAKDKEFKNNMIGFIQELNDYDPFPLKQYIIDRITFQLKKHHFMNLGVMKDYSLTTSKAFTEAKENLSESIDRFIDSSPQCQINQYQEEHENNFENLEDFDLEENLNELYITQNQEKDQVPDPEEVVEIPQPEDKKDENEVQKNSSESTVDASEQVSGQFGGESFDDMLTPEFQQDNKQLPTMHNQGELDMRNYFSLNSSAQTNNQDKLKNQMMVSFNEDNFKKNFMSVTQSRSRGHSIDLDLENSLNIREEEDEELEIDNEVDNEDNQIRNKQSSVEQHNHKYQQNNVLLHENEILDSIIEKAFE